MSDIFEETGVKRYALRYRENSFSPWEYPSMRQQEGRDFRVQFSAPGATEAAQIIRAGYVLQVCGAAATAIISTQGRVTIRAGVLLPAQNDVALSVLIVLQSIFLGYDHTRPSRSPQP